MKEVRGWRLGIFEGRLACSEPCPVPSNRDLRAPLGASGMWPSRGCYSIPTLQVRKLRHRKAGKGQRQDLNRATWL